MAIFKPAGADNGGNSSKFYGIIPVAITDFTNKSGEWSWADLFLSVTLNVEGSDYDKFLEIKGEFEKDGNGDISGGSVLNRLYKFFELIGCDAGLSVKNEWEDPDGNPIADIASYLRQRHVTGNPASTKYDFVAYIYKRKPQPGKKAYSTVHTRLFPNTDKGKADLASHVEWMKTKGYFKEATESEAGPIANGETPVLVRGDNL